MTATHDTNWAREMTGVSVRQIALKFGVDPSSFDRRMKKNLTADLVLEIAEMYGLNPVEALTRSGIISPQAGMSAQQKLSHAIALLKEAEKELKQQHNPHVLHVVQDKDIIQEANEYPAAAQDRTPYLQEPDSP